MSRWGIGLSEKMKACKEAEPFTDILDGDGGVPEKDPPSSSKAGFKVTTMKIIVWVCILNGLAWVWCSYILALLGREQIAEALSQVALKEIIGVVLVFRPAAGVRALTALMGLSLLCDGVLNLTVALCTVKIVNHQRPDVIETDDFEIGKDE